MCIISYKILAPLNLILLFFNSSLLSQQSILLNQSAYNLYVLSPAAVGLNNEINANCHYKKNWLGLSESPELVQFTIDGALSKNKYGLGLNLMNEKSGIFSKTYFSGAFKYKLKLVKTHFLSFGISAGFQKQQSDFSKIKADSPDEFIQWPQQQSVTIPDAAFGLAYTYKRFYLTASASQILQQKYVYKEPVFEKGLSYKTISQFIFSIQNTFVLNPERWSYTPHLTIRTLQGLPIQIDLLNSLVYKNKLLIGIGYRNHYAVYFNLGYFISQKLRIIYSYEYSLGIQSAVKGGHEIGICFGLLNHTINNYNSDEKLSDRKLEEVYEIIDQRDQQMEVLTKKVNSMDQNLLKLQVAFELLKKQQVNQKDIKDDVENYSDSKMPSQNIKNSNNKNYIEGKYKVISSRTENDHETFSDTTKANYKIVLGVYQLLTYAKEFQKFLKREIGIETILVQLEGHPKKYIYVCELKEFENIKEAIDQLEITRRKAHSKANEITHGDAWILQTLIK